MNHPSLSGQPELAPTAPVQTPATFTPAPGSFFARLQRVFAGTDGTEQPAGIELDADREEFFEYHNPTLGVAGFGDLR